MSVLKSNKAFNAIKGLFTGGTDGLVERSVANSIARRTNAAGGLTTAIKNLEMSKKVDPRSLLPAKRKANSLYESIGKLEGLKGGKGAATEFVKATGPSAVGSMAQEYFLGSNLSNIQKAARIGAGTVGAATALGVASSAVGRATSSVGDLTHDKEGKRDVFGVPFI